MKYKFALLLLLFSTAHISFAQLDPAPESKQTCSQELKAEVPGKFWSIFGKKGYIFGGLKKIIHFIVAQEQAIHFPYEPGVLAKAKRALQEIGIFSARALSPISYPFFSLPTEEVFLRQWKQADYQPTAEESELLKKYKTLEEFTERGEFLKSHPRWHKFRRQVERASNAAITLSFILALNFAYQANAETIPAQTYLSQPKFRPDKNQIQLINETAPFPHLSLRMGDKVYSYGVSHMTAKPVNFYLRSIPAHARGKLDALARSVQVVTLNLSETERLNLKRDLETATAMRYYNVTHVNDCSTMIIRALKRRTSIQVSPLIDASPSQVMMYFGYLKSLGDSRVGPIYQVDIDSPEYAKAHLARNTYINILESKLFLFVLPINTVHRSYVNATHDESRLQSRDREVDAAIATWKKDVADLIAADEEVKFIEERIEALAKGARHDPQELRDLIEEHFNEEIQHSQNVIDDYNSDFKDIILNQYRIELLRAKKDALLRRILH